MSEKGDGRGHNATGFTIVMAGGGIQGGRAYRITDESGLHAVEARLHVHDLHSTNLDLMGLDHRKLVYPHKGRPHKGRPRKGRPRKGRLYGSIASPLLDPCEEDDDSNDQPDDKPRYCEPD